MGGGDLNTKKSWHPSTLKNQERVWAAEQEARREEARIAELRRERGEERQREELGAQGRAAGVLPAQADRLSWMYNQPNKTGDSEEYLLGKTIDNNFERLAAEDKTAAPPKNHVEHEVIPFSIRQLRGPAPPPAEAAASQVDLARKLLEDPLAAVRARELQARAQLLQNPLRLQQLTRLLKDDQAKRKEKKSKKKSKKHKSDIDQLLAEKLSRLEDKKIDIASLLSDKKKKKKKKKSKSDSDSSDTEEEKVKRKKKKRKESESQEEKYIKKNTHDSDSDDNKKKKKSKRDFEVEVRSSHARNKNKMFPEDNGRSSHLKKKNTIDSEDEEISHFRKKNKRNSEENDRSSHFRKTNKVDSEDEKRSFNINKDKMNSEQERLKQKNKRSLEEEQTSQIRKKSKKKSEEDDRSSHLKNKNKTENLEEEKKSSHLRKKLEDLKSVIEARYNKKNKAQHDSDEKEVRKRSASPDSSHRSKNKEKTKDPESFKNKLTKDKEKRETKKKRNSSYSEEESPKKKSNDTDNTQHKKKERRGSHERIRTNKSSHCTQDSSPARKIIHRKPSTDDSDSADERRPTKFGLVSADGTKLTASKTEDTRKAAKTVKKEEKWKRPVVEKLTDKEKEQRLKEMMSAAAERDSERERNLKRHRESMRREESVRSDTLDPEFATRQAARAAGGSVQDRLRSNVYNIQRSSRHMDHNFARR